MFRSLALALVLSIGTPGCNDVQRSSHATRAAADHAIRQGWIPSVLPESALDIGESHNLDANAGHGTFRFGPSDAGSFRSAMTPVSATERLRTQNIDRAGFEGRGYVFYKDAHFDIAVDWSRQVGEFWLHHSE